MIKLSILNKLEHRQNKLKGCYCCLVTQLCPTLCDPMDCNPHALLYMRFFRQKYWSGLPFPTPEDLPDPGIEHMPPALAGDSLPWSHHGGPFIYPRNQKSQFWAYRPKTFLHKCTREHAQVVYCSVAYGVRRLESLWTFVTSG